MKRGGKIWIRVFPDKPVTKKPAETRMGKGKGAPDHWVAVVRPGKILFEMEGVTLADASEAMRLASHKLALRTTLVKREGAKARTRKKLPETERLLRNFMKVDKIRNLTEEELRNQEGELADQLFKLKFQLNMGQTESLKKIRGLRKDIARVKTIRGERERSAATEKR